MAQRKDAFEIEKLRHKLASEHKYDELLKTYSSNLPEIKNLNTRDFWDKKFINDRESYKKNSIYADKIRIVSKIISDIGGKFLDIGIGFAYLEDILKKSKKINLSGIDISEKVIHFAKKNFKGDFKEGSILKIPFKDKLFNIVAALDVLEHISPKNIFKAYKEVSRVLKNRGYFVISIPVNEGLEKLYKGKMNTGGHVRVYTPDIIEGELKLAGFIIIKTFYRSAFKKYYSLKTIISKISPVKLRNPNMIIIVAQKI